MDLATDKVLSDLLSICQACKGHGNNPDSYTSPGFSEYLNRALTIADIPMQSYNIERTSRKDPNTAPWEDSIKNFIFDMVSFNTYKKFKVCMLLVEMDYKYTDTTLKLLANKYCTDSSVLVSVEYDSVQTDDIMDDIIFKIKIVKNGIVEYTADITPDCLVATLVSWYVPNDTIILCHDNTIQEYKDSISMMPDVTWSISCTTTTFIECESARKECKYICPTYSCLGSLETRAVGSGPIKETCHKIPTAYEGKLNYYLRCVRGSKHSSGRCYDCQSLFKVVTSVYKSPEPSPAKKNLVKFSSQFLASAALKSRKR